MFGTIGGFLATVRATFFNKYKDPDAMVDGNNKPSNPGQLVQIAVSPKA
jgi:hypothetical protein